MGKTFSFCFLPFLYLCSGAIKYPLLIVISPLIALMEDQVRQISAMGIPAVHFSSASSVLPDSVNLIFISPELATVKLRSILRTVRSRLAGLVVDEAHCVSEW